MDIDCSLKHCVRANIILENNMGLVVCDLCQHHYMSTASQCPHCKHHVKAPRTSLGMALLLGISLVGCGTKDGDTADTSGSSDTADTLPGDTADQPLYGVPDSGFAPEYGVEIVDNDGDGWDAEIDCDDGDATVFPGSAELESTEACMRDVDGDGYGDSSAVSPVEAGTDCDDGDATIHPNASDPDKDCVD